MDGPNFVIIVADQLRADAVGAFGSPIASTPNLDALAERGTTFTNAFVQNPVCSPSRASFLTGWYPHTRGHRSLTHLLRPEDPNLLKSLKEHGWHVTHVGMRGDTWAPGGTEASCHEYGWIEPPTITIGDVISTMDPDDPMARAFYAGKTTDELDFDEACVRSAETWLGRRPNDRPWCLYVPLFFPHCPFATTDPWFSMHDRPSMPPPRPTVQSGHEPTYMSQLRDLYGTGRLAEREWQEIAATYHGMVSRCDAHVGRILDALGPDLDDTVVMFFSDHGEYLGDYGLIEKWPSGMHDCLTRDPLIIAGPDLGEGQVVESMVEMIDVMATVLDLANIEADHTHFGRSLLPVIDDPLSGHRTHAFTEGGFLIEEAHLLESPSFPYDLKGLAQRERPAAVGKAVAVRTQAWTYVWRLYEEPELYDRTADPDELHNLAGIAAHAETERQLHAAIMRWSVATGDNVPWDPDPRFPRIQLPVPGAALSSRTAT